jgi:hypothetical protein
MQPCFLLSEVQHVNPIDRSFGIVFARWRGLGILSLARLARTGDERALAVVRDPNRGIFEVSFIMEIDTRINALWSVDVLRQFSARTVKENQIDLANKQRWIMKQLRCINDAARDILVATSKVTLPKGSRARKFASNPLSGFPELSQPTWGFFSLNSQERRVSMHPIAIVHEVQKLYKVNDRLESLAEQHPVVSEALITISGSVRNTATLLEVMIATKMAPVSGLEPASAWFDIGERRSRPCHQKISGFILNPGMVLRQRNIALRTETSKSKRLMADLIVETFGGGLHPGNWALMLSETLWSLAG